MHVSTCRRGRTIPLHARVPHEVEVLEHDVRAQVVHGLLEVLDVDEVHREVELVQALAPHGEQGSGGSAHLASGNADNEPRRQEVYTLSVRAVR